MEVLGLYTWLSINADENGEIAVSRAGLSRLTGLSEQTIRTALEKLAVTKKVTKKVTKEVTKSKSVLIVCYLSTYKCDKNKSNQESNQENDQENDQHSVYKNDNINIKSLYNNNIYNNINIKENSTNVELKKVEDSPFKPTQSQEDERFVEWMKKNYPRVSSMKKPMKLSDFKNLQASGFSSKAICSILDQMENWAKLNTKVSAFLTAKNWLKRDCGQNGKQ